MSWWNRKSKLTRQEVAQILEEFLEGTGSWFAWDSLTLGMSFEDEYLEKIRIRCAQLSQEFPPEKPHEYCNEHGRDVIRDYINELRVQK
jgi:hypothetical protein